MNTRKKNQIEYTVDSALALMQEIHIELCENRAQALVLFKKMMAFMKDANDLETLGPIIKDQQKIMVDTLEKKIQLSKLQNTILLKQNEGKGGLTKMTISATEREMLESLIDNRDQPQQ
jgi:isocitrate lyase